MTITSPESKPLLKRSTSAFAALTLGVTTVVAIAPPASADDTPTPVVIKGTTAQTTQIINPTDPDSVFGDVVAVHAMSPLDESVVDDDAWPAIEGELLPFVARFTIYKNDMPLLESPVPTGTAVTSFSRAFAGPGDWTMTSSDLPAGVWDEMRATPGFYSVTTEFRKADQGANADWLQEDTLDGYTLPAATVAITSELPWWWVTSDKYGVHFGDPLSASVTPDGVPTEYPGYTGGVPGFPAAHTFDITLWEISVADRALIPLGTTEIPPSATLVKTYSSTLENGYFTIGGDQNVTNDGTCYVWHATFNGDSFYAPYASNLGIPHFWQCPPVATVSVTALNKYSTPANGNSYEWQYAITALGKANYFAVGKMVVPVVDDTLPISEWVCDLSKKDNPIAINGDFPAADFPQADDFGLQTSSAERYAAPGTCILFKAAVVGWFGEALAETSWDDPGARTIIIPPPSVSASVVEQRVTVGSLARAMAQWEYVLDAPTVEFYSQTVSVVDSTLPTDEWECDLSELDDANAEMVGSPQPTTPPPAQALSEPVATTKEGTCVIFQAVLVEDDYGAVIADSDWEDLDAQVFVLPPDPDDQVFAAPTIRAQVVDAVVAPGGTTQDQAWYENAPKGATVEFAYQAVPTVGLSAPMMDGFCDTAKATDQAAQLAGSPTVVNASSGTVLSAMVPAPAAGTCILFKAILRDKDGKKLAETSWDDPHGQARVAASPATPPTHFGDKRLAYTGNTTGKPDLILAACLLMLGSSIMAVSAHRRRSQPHRCQTAPTGR